MGYPVKLDTNGSRPEVVKALVEEGLVDYLALDVKAAPGLYPEAIAESPAAGEVEETLQFAMKAHEEKKISAEFRTTCFSPIVDENVVMSIARRLQGPIPLFLQPARTTSVLSPSLVAAAGDQPRKEVLAGWAAKASAWLPCEVR
jgi:pyruvate formate lyase activating enzyme